MENETFSEFKNSFYYGPRSDLSFKFLKSLSDEAAAEFVRTLFTRVMAAMDSGDWLPVAQHVIDGQTAAYSTPSTYSYDSAPFAPLAKPLAEMRLGLLTSSGHFVEGDDPRPFGVAKMSQFEATVRISEFLREPPTLSTIPFDTPPEQLQVRHGGYDIQAASTDPNVILPLGPFKSLVEAGVVGEIAKNAYSFVGACAQTPLRNKSAPAWAEMLKKQGIEAMVLVPG